MTLATPGPPTSRTPSPAAPSPAALMSVVTGARAARILYAADHLDVFSTLAERAATPAELAERLGLRPDATADLLATLAGLGLLERDGPRYRGTPVTDFFLARSSPGYLGGFLEFCRTVLDPAFDGLAHTLRTGESVNTAAGDGDPFRPHYDDSAARDAFLAAMDTLSRPLAVLLSGLDWSGQTDVVDVGGARGDLAARLANAQPHLRVSVFDLPQVAPAAHAHLAALQRAGVARADTVSFVAGDFFTDPLPTADAVIFGHVLHNWDRDARVELLRAAFRALRPGGRVLIYDPLLNPENPAYAAALSSLNMRVWTAGGSEYTEAEATDWLHNAGFVDVGAQPLGPNDILLTAVKRG
ncbi:methyltransferase [Protofrankia symbiont of Coriaria ruscifolia]|uniref:methyltransferase n=1 Tax=Protofrankia symbiont of Coriaria ruscifolia TaxID=1306542 RepID=UPI00104168C5|nr:methyltransferase [Protofrankia symbiont of Coriaria ruscifolia]